jgi:hypothetical protein
VEAHHGTEGSPWRYRDSPWRRNTVPVLLSPE